MSCLASRRYAPRTEMARTLRQPPPSVLSLPVHPGPAVRETEKARDRHERRRQSGGVTPVPPTDDRRRRLSLLVPAYNEVEGASELVPSGGGAQAVPDLDVELVVVDDGSTDGTARRFRGANRQTRRCRRSLSRNFGSHAALTAGPRECSGDAALTLSADRQEPLSAVVDFIGEWPAGPTSCGGCAPPGRLGKAAVGAATGFSAFFSAHSDVPTYPAEGPSQVLLDRRVIDVLNHMPEANRNLLAMVAWLGFDQRRILFEQLPRPYGTSKWTSRRRSSLSSTRSCSSPMRRSAGSPYGFGCVWLGAPFGGAVAALTRASFPVAFTVLSGLVMASAEGSWARLAS